MKKSYISLLCLLLCLSGCSGSAEKVYNPGTYTASSNGFGGKVEVSIEVDESKIVDVKITGANETAGIGEKAITEMPEKILAANSIEVESVSGATITSTAIINALEKCIAQAKGEEASAAMIPGTYKSTVKGFYGDFEVEVEVNETNILSVKASENMETVGIGSTAIEVLNKEMVEFNSVGVDVVTGATLTSRAYLNAVGECLKQAEAPESMYEEVAYSTETINKSSDVVVVGSGAAGLAAAINAAENGAKVILIEKQGILGGSTRLSAGIVYAALNEADVSVMENYYQTRAEGKADSEIVNFFAENSMNTIEWLTNNGVSWFMQVPAGTAPEPRANFAAGFTGASLVDPLIKKANELGIEIIINCEATELTTANGVITGVKAEGKNGTYTFDAKAVVLATGGFDASEEMKQEYSPIAVGDFPLSNKGNTGDGIKMGIAVGADTDFKGGIIGFDFVDGSLSNSGQSGIAMGAPIYVTGDGEYLINNVDYPITYTAMKNSGKDKFFGIYDATGEANGELAISLGFGYKAETLDELANLTKMDATKLNEAVKDSSIAAGPYYAVVAKPCTIGSMGGLKINTKAEVLDKNGVAIPGLYAAGEVANGGLYYQEYPASGTSNSMSFTYGLEAGENAAEYVGK